MRDMARRVANGIHNEIPPAAAEFMQRQSFAIIGGTDHEGAVWASALYGKPGFIKAVDAHTARIQALPVAGDPLNDILQRASEGHEAKLGVLLIELETRHRMRLNGRAVVLPDGALEVHTDQVYANCPKYIQKRVWQPSPSSPQSEASVSRSGSLSPGQQAFISRADTFFVASASVDGSADASHRGGLPGFVRIIDGRRLLWPDYSGNTMFNTLGNIAVNPHAGLLFLDFETGIRSRLTGGARIIWDEDQAAKFAGAERLVSFEIDQVIETRGAIPGCFRFVEASPFNPG